MKKTVYLVVMLGLFGMGLIFFQQPIKQQLDTWRLLPRHERVSELYFADTKLPTVLPPGGEQTIRFTVHNLEFQTTGYQYDIVVKTPDGSAKQVLADGAFMIGHDHSQTISRAIIVPHMGDRLVIQVHLHYKSIAVGRNVPAQQSQVINYSVRANG
jgi:hypothetical protein